MNKWLCFLLIAAMLAMTGCMQEAPEYQFTLPPPTQTDQSAATEPTAAPPTAVYDAPLASVSLVDTHIPLSSNGLTIAQYSYQEIAVSLTDGDVAQTVTLDLLNRIDRTASPAQQVLDAALADYNGQEGFVPFFYKVAYTPTRFDRNVLSFYGTEQVFDASPQSQEACISVNYDLTTGQVLTLPAILHSDYSADYLCDLILSDLAQQEISSLYDGYDDSIRQKFAVNSSVESWYFTDKGLCFYFAPYEIAPKSQGTVVSLVPYSRLGGMLKDQYFPQEPLMYSGTLQAQPAQNTQGLTEFAELELTPQAERLLLRTQGSVSQVTVRQGGRTVFYAPGLGPSHGLMLRWSPENPQDSLDISFFSDGIQQYLTLTVGPNGKPVLQ